MLSLLRMKHDVNGNLQIGNSLFDSAGAEKVVSLIEKAKANNIKVVFPVDFITADNFDKDANVGFCDLSP